MTIPSGTALVLTSINAPNPVLKSLRDGARDANVRFIVIGATKSPAEFALQGCEFLDVKTQLGLGLKFANLSPRRHYARKNIGYLLAIKGKAPLIIETDD